LSDETKDLYTLIGKYEEFSKQVLGRIDIIDGRMDSGDKRMGRIEQKIANPPVCPYHSIVINKLELKDQKDEEHDKAISEIKTENAVQEVKLNATQEKQLNVTTGGTAILAVYQGLKLVLSIFGVHLP